jgi:hypothetical protein
MDLKEIQRIGLEAAAEIFAPDQVKHLEVSRVRDAWGHPEYDFEFVIYQDHDRETALAKRLRLSLSLRDKLVAAGDDDYPNVRVLNALTDSPVG